MSYPIVNLPRSLGQSEPTRRVPQAPADCGNNGGAGTPQEGVDNAAMRIAYYRTALQAAVAAGDQAGIDAANAGSILANQDWQAWSKVVKDCAAFAPLDVQKSASTPMWIPIVLAGVVGLIVVGSITVPKLIKV